MPRTAAAPASILRVVQLRGGASASSAAGSSSSSSNGCAVDHTVEYAAAARLQEALRRRRVANECPSDCLLLLQHPSVYTLGRRTAKEARRIAGATGGGAPASGSDDVGGAGAAGLRLSHPELRFDEAFLSKHGASVSETKRGGQVTYHGPGQLVGYPVVHLRQLARRTRDRTLSPSGYIPAIEEALCAALGQLGVQGARGRSAEGAQNTGLWIGEAKVAALGVHIAHGVATHGFGLNVDERPLPFFEHIVPCGLERPVTCVAHHLPDNMCNDGGHEGGGGGPDAAGLLMSRVQEEVVAQFVSRFQYSAVTWATLTVAEALAAACTATADTATEEDGWGGGAADGHDGVYRARCALGMEAGTALQSSPPRP